MLLLYQVTIISNSSSNTINNGTC